MVLNREEARALLPVLESTIEKLKLWMDDATDDKDLRRMLGTERLEILERIAVKARKLLHVAVAEEE